MKQIALILTLIFVAAACNKAEPVTVNPAPSPQTSQENHEQQQTVNFAGINSTYKFSGMVYTKWNVEYVASSDSINIYDPSVEAGSNLEKSQIFIRNFRANSFLTLTTVDILSRQETTVKNRPAVRYEIKKKAGVANFPNQPTWRSGQHKLIDIRHSQSNPSTFYVIAYNPLLSQDVFGEFITSLDFQD